MKINTVSYTINYKIKKATCTPTVTIGCLNVRCVEASFMMINQVDSSSFDEDKDDDKKSK